MLKTLLASDFIVDKHQVNFMKTFNAAVVLSGCGVYDGSEIHEAVITLLNLQKLGARVSFFAPDIPQLHALNHINGEAEESTRSVLVESARIARGNITPLSEFNADNFDTLLFPGGFGAAKNLSNFALSGTNMEVDGDVENAIQSMLKARKPICFICIAPVIAAKVISNCVNITIGNDPQTAEVINALGAKHIDCAANSFVKDEKFNIYSTPAYMLAQNTVELDAGISAMLKEMVTSLK